MVNVLPTFSSLAIITLCAIAYFPLSNRMAQADFQSISYGSALANLLPVFLSTFAVVFTCVMFYISTQTVRNNK